MNNYLKRLKKRIDTVEYVSFDLFDTLIYRAVTKPTDVFKVVAGKLGVDPELFCIERCNAEKRAGLNSVSEEITLKDIYMSFENEFGKKMEMMMSVEIECELALCYLNYEMHQIYEYCLGKNKIVVLTSDMYLPEDVIIAMLDKCGIKDYSKLFLSSKEKVKKSTGNLFKKVIEENIISDKRKLLHIGDNFKSDYFVPIRLGINAYLYRGMRKRLNTNWEKSLLDYIRSSKGKDKSFFYKFGFSTLGPLVLGYIQWIVGDLQKNKIDKIYFFAREGQFLKRAYDIVAVSDKCEEQYLYVSRRSLVIPMVSLVDNIDDFVAIRPVNANTTIGDYIKSVGLSKEEFSDTPWYPKVDFAEYLSRLPEEVKDSLLHDIFSKVRQNSEYEYSELLKYLEQMNVCSRFAVIDLGWNGTMQRALEEILRAANIEHDIYGYFLAQRDEFYKNEKSINNQGYLFNYNDAASIENNMINSACGFIELLFCADHGSTIRYETVDGQVFPVLEDYEFQKEYPYIRECQNGALDFIMEYKNNYESIVRFSKDILVAPFYHILKTVPDDVIEQFGDFSMSNTKSMQLAKKCKLFPIKKFISEFIESCWKTAYLKRNLHIPFPLTAYSILRKLFN